MENVTLLIAAACSIVIWFVSPTNRLTVYIASLIWYPVYLTVEIGTIDFSVSRMVILVLYLRLALEYVPFKNFKFILLDYLVIIYCISEFVAGVFNVEIMELLENRGGAMFDTILPYFAVRLIITSKAQYIQFLKGILFVGCPLAIVGFYQSLTGNNPFGFLREYHAWADVVSEPIQRMGFYRADVTFSVHIMFGFFFAMFVPIIAGLLVNMKRNLLILIAGLGLMCMGLFSSMSSSPFLSGFLSIVFLFFYRFRRYTKQVIVIAVLLCLSIEIVSNRHFYDLLGAFTMNPGTAWYRGRLIDVAFFEGGMSGHWGSGFGFEDPGWGPMIDMRNYTDVVNHYIVVLCRYGLIGLVPFMALLAVAVRNLYRVFKMNLIAEERWLVWCLGASFFGLLISLNAVWLFGQTITLFYIMLGFCGAMPFIAFRADAERQFCWKMSELSELSEEMCLISD